MCPVHSRRGAKPAKHNPGRTRPLTGNHRFRYPSQSDAPSRPDLFGMSDLLGRLPPDSPEALRMCRAFLRELCETLPVNIARNDTAQTFPTRPG